MMTLDVVNAMHAQEFINVFGDVAEHSPWVAAQAAEACPFDKRDKMIEVFASAVRNATLEKQLALIRAHPDLASKVKLTDHSQREQADAGLTSLTTEEMAEFTRLNAAYKAKFSFPFVFSVKGADKNQILDSFRERIANSTEDELSIAIAQVCNILRFRIEGKVAP
jgi:2-oxo-4-hydroxy-4-carboxy-5-ureidoimidazoline decarboxylase